MPVDLKFIEGFSHYTNINQKWDGGTAVTINTTGGAFGNGKMVSGAFIISPYIIVGNLDTFIVGVRFRWISQGASVELVYFNDQINLTSSTQARLSLNAGGFLQMKKGDGTVVQQASNALVLNNWYFLEIAVRISTGAYEARVGEQTILSGTTPLKQTANTTADRVFFIGNNAGEFADINIQAGSGSFTGEFFGDAWVERLLPNAEGDFLDFTPGGTGTPGEHFSRVDEPVLIAGDTDYVESNTVNHRDCYHFQDTQAEVIHGVQLNLAVRKTEAEARSIKPFARPVVTNYDGAVQQVQDTYIYKKNMWELNPETSLAWTNTLFNASQFGIKIET